MSIFLYLATFCAFSTIGAAAAGHVETIHYRVQGSMLGTKEVHLLAQEAGGGYRLPRQSDPDTVQNGSVFQDTHIYYNSTFLTGDNAEALWIDLAELYRNNDSNVTRSPLSDERLRVRYISLPFTFPYYGHLLSRIGVTTSGFLSTGPFHSRIIDFQYLAPLQANFHPGLSNDSFVYIYSTAERFTIQWENVLNVDHLEAGPFTFQVSLFPSGDIYFAYETIPLGIQSISSTEHPVRVGISDAYFFEIFRRFGRVFGFIIEYHMVDVSAYNISSNTAILLHPLPNCIGASSCTECANVSTTSDFECGWCPALSRCSDGIDRRRQEWLRANCHNDADLSFCEDNSEEVTSTAQSRPSTLTLPPSPASSTESSEISTEAGVVIMPFSTSTTLAYPSHQLPSTASTVTQTVVSQPLHSSGTPGQTSSLSLSSSSGIETGVPPNPEAQSGGGTGETAGIAVGVLIAILVAAAVLVTAVIAVALYCGYKHPSTRLGTMMTARYSHPLRFKYRGSSDFKEEKLIQDDDSDF